MNKLASVESSLTNPVVQPIHEKSESAPLELVTSNKNTSYPILKNESDGLHRESNEDREGMEASVTENYDPS